MQTLLAVAAVLATLIGVVHSVLGELLIFRHLRKGTLVPAGDAPPLSQRHIRILWATWHLATVFGWAFAAVLARLSITPHASLPALLAGATVGAYAGGSLLVLVGTKGRHPGWFALAVVAALTWIALGRA